MTHYSKGTPKLSDLSQKKEFVIFQFTFALAVIYNNKYVIAANYLNKNTIYEIKIKSTNLK